MERREPSPPTDGARRIPRREFLVKAGTFGAGIAAGFARLPGALLRGGMLDGAAAQDPDLTRDTLNGLVAFILPGPDTYSVAQGETDERPGGIDAGTTDILISNLDAFLPAADVGGGTDETVPISGAVAGLLNTTAAQVNPAAAGGAFPSHFSRLSFAEKAEVFRIIEATSGTDDVSAQLRFVGGILPGFTAFLAFGEWQVFDPETRKLTERPVGWELTRYQPGRTVPAEGFRELKGYYRGHRKASGR